MMNTYSKIFFVLISFAFSLLPQQSFAQHSNCAASPYPIDVKQPDGSTIMVVGKGHESLSYAETLDGYTLLKNSDGVYEYAIHNQAGDLVPSGVKAVGAASRNANQSYTLTNLAKHLKYSSDQIANIEAEANHHSASHKQLPWGFPAQGTNKVLMILIDYPDLQARFPKEDFEDFAMEEDYNGTGSFRDYFLDISFDQLDLDIDVFGWYTAQNNFQYYGRQNGNGVARELVREAVDAAEMDGVDFSEYDNDNDGDVDGLVIVHAGNGAEQGAQLQYIWSHRSSLGGLSRTYDGTLINDYNINPETRNTTNMVGIGVFVHEFGHILGLPDLYDTNDNNGESAGLGNWALMSSGNWLNGERTPSGMSSWSKWQLGWQEPVVINTNGTYTMDPATDSNLTYRINTSNPGEFFLLENRQKTGFDEFLPGTGLAIWHITLSKTSLYPGSNSVNADEDLKGVDLEEADGLYQLDNDVNRGNAGDLFPGSFNRTSFDNTTDPNSRLNNGDSTGIAISAISENNGIITFDLGSKPKAAYSPSKVAGCAPLTVDFTNNSSFVNRFAWDFGTGNIDSTSNPSFTFTEGGFYDVVLRALDENGIVIDSFVNTINVHATPVADFTFTGTGTTVDFKNASQDDKFYEWDFGDGSQKSFIADPSHTYSTVGQYEVTFVAYSENVCSDTSKQTVDLAVLSVGGDVSSEIKLAAYPNPYNTSTSISFQLTDKSPVQIDVFDMLGNHIQTIADNELSAGVHQYQFSASEQGLSSGVYIVRVQSSLGKAHLRLIEMN